MEDVLDIQLPEVPDMPPIDLPAEEALSPEIHSTEIQDTSLLSKLDVAGSPGRPDWLNSTAEGGVSPPHQALTEPTGPEMSELPTLFYDPPQEAAEERANLGVQVRGHEAEEMAQLKHPPVASSYVTHPHWPDLSQPEQAEWPSIGEHHEDATLYPRLAPVSAGEDLPLAAPFSDSVVSQDMADLANVETPLGPSEIEATEFSDQDSHAPAIISHLASIAAGISKLVEHLPEDVKTPRPAESIQLLRR